VCEDSVRTVSEPYTETDCKTEYKEDCEYQWEGQGQAKVWVPIAGTCQKNPYETCNDVTKQRQVQVPHQVCNDVPEQKCTTVSKQECRTVNEQVCENIPYQQCNKIPKQDCNSVHKKVPKRVSRVPKKVCDGGNNNNRDLNNEIDNIHVRSSNDAIRFA